MQVGKEFGTVMKRVFDHFAALDFDEKTVNSIGRVVHIWAERGIFDKRVQGRARQNCQAVNWFRRRNVKFFFIQEMYTGCGVRRI